MGPFLWLADASFTPEAESGFRASLSEHPGCGCTFPTQPTLDNYVQLFRLVPFALYFRNSLIIATGNMALTLIVASLGAYGPRTLSASRGAIVFLVGILVTYTVPSVVLLVPLLVIFRTYGLNNTHVGMVLAEATHTAPFALLLLINYFATLPKGVGRGSADRRLQPAAGVMGDHSAAVPARADGRRSSRLHQHMEQLSIRFPVYGYA